jgi:hypothetical protein
MEVFIAFELDPGRNPLKQLARALCGPQVRAELLVRQGREGAELTTYRARLFHCFEAAVWAGGAGHYTERTHEVFRITGLSSEDSERICRTCRACVQKRIPYNARDMMLAGTMAPTFHNDPQPDPRDVFSAESLYCAQSVVLILRGCLPPAHPLAEALAGVNSRAVTPSSLCELVRPLCVRVVWC